MSELPFHLLPPKLKEIADYCGEETMWLLWKHYGGGHVNVPKQFDAEHGLAQILRSDLFFKLCQNYGGEAMMIPKADAARRTLRNQRIKKLRGDGLTVFGLARKFDLTERQIITICGDAQRPSSNLDLFNED